MAKSKALALKDIQKNVTAITESDTLPPALMKALEDKVPQFVKEYEADGTAILRWNLEHLMIIEQILQDKFDFTEDELVKLEKNIKEILPAITQFKAETPRLITRQDYYVAKANVERNKFLYQAEKAGIVLPHPEDKKKLK